jgi:hypothetical protein
LPLYLQAQTTAKAAIIPLVTTDGVTNNGCLFSQTWTANYTDSCGNAATPVSITYTWTVDTEAPVLSTTAVSGDLGCNPTVVAPVFTGTDNCEGTITPLVTTDGATNNGCLYSQTWTANYTDSCGNAATPVSITYTWTEDLEAPVLSTIAVSGDLGCNPTVVAPIFTGTDNCEGAITPLVTTDGATNNGCLYSQTWTANYTDSCGNAATPVSITYTWTVDAEAPVLTTTAVSGDLGCNPTVVAPVFTGTDNCEGAITPLVTTDGATNNGCLYSQTWTANYTDSCGNAATPVSITYTWTVDTEAPVLSTTAVSGDLGCNPTVVAPVFTGTDNCEGTITPLVTTDGATNNGCLYSQTWTANYTDSCGNVATPVSITYTWTVDTEAPVLSTTAVSGDLGCNPTVVAPVFTGTDNCEGAITPLVTTDGATNNGCLYSQTWTANYTDSCGNAATPISITYTWTVDTEAPVLSTIAVSGDLGCNPTVVAPVFTGTDNCEGAITPLVTTDGVTSNGCLYSQTWTANYTDSCGNAATTVSITYTWTVDTEAPVLSTTAVSGDLGCNPTVVAPVFTGTDNCEGVITPLVTTDGATNNGCLFSQTWTANYTDSCGNEATPVSITYTWTVDTEAPVLSTIAVSGDLGCNPTVVAPVFTGTDNCEGAITPLVTTDGATNNGCLFSQTWAANYTDSCGNVATPISITYTWTEDLEAPVLSTTAVSGDLGCNPTVVAPTFTGTDNCDDTVVPEVTTDGPINTSGCLWSQTWTANFTDSCGNAATPISITYTWTVDTEAPVLSTIAVSGDLGCNPTVVAPVFTGTDNCEGTIIPVVTTDGVTNNGCLFSQTWTANYTDSCGNAATPVSITYTWTVDTEAPVLSTIAVSGDLGCNPTVVAPVFTGTDNCEGTITPLVTTDGATNNGCLYSQTWTANYTDSCGNAATPVSITYTWTVDTEAPVLSTTAVSGDLGCNPTVVAPIFTGTDNCEGTITPEVTTDGMTNNGCLYSQTWTATYTDACGNAATPVSITYTWTVDTEAPVLTTTAVSGDLGCNPTVVAPIFTGTDNCEGAITPVVSTDGATNNGCLYSQTWTSTYTDACDNAATPVSITYTWTVDTEAPVLTTTAVSGDLGCNPTVVAPIFTGTDNCEGAITPLVTTDGATNNGCLYSQTWTANYTDSCGNAATPVSITYTWTEDLEAPVLSTTAVSGDLGCNPTVVAPIFTGTDNCEGAITPLVTTDGATNNGCLYSQTWTANYTDSCGNAATPVSITYTWTVDAEAPVLTTTAVSGDLGCNPTVVAPVFTGTDNCEGTIIPVVTTDGVTNNGCLFSQTWTANYTDSCGNAATPVSITYTWTVDTEAPVLSTIAVSGDLGCNPTVVAPVFTGTDNCEGTITPLVTTDGATNNGCLYSQTWTANYTDSCGNAATPVSITYTWTVDTEAPVLSTTAVSGDLGCNPTVVAPIFTGTDNCEGTITPEVTTDGMTNNGCLYSQTWTATYTDACDNAAIPVSITYTWTEDTEVPVINTLAVSGDLGCNPTVVAPIFTGTDNCEGTITPEVTTDGMTNNGCLYSQTWTATYTDACDNAAIPVSITYTWTEDTEVPVINTLAVSGDLGCNPTVVAPVFTGTDNCEGAITPLVTTDGATNNGCLYSQTWTANYTDSCGNAATPVSITYTWTVDTEAPVLSTIAVSGDLGCNPTVVAPVFSGSDNCEGAITPLVTTDGATNNGCLYSQTWTANYTDSCGNAATPVSITYTWTEDLEAPVLSTTAVSGDLGCNPTVVAPVFTGSDNCEGVITPVVTTDGATNNGCLYSQTWTATYTDACGNAATPVSITYTWTVDTEAPVLTTTAVSGDLGCNPTVVAPIFTGSDNCEGAITPVVSTDGATNNGCLYSQTWTSTYTDACDNAATPVSITYTWTVDTEAPVLTTTAVSGDLGCNPTVVAPIFTGTDNCEGAITPVVSTDGATNNGCLYSQTWTATYTDACGNAATPVSITYTWTVDTEAPVLTTTAVSGDLGCNPTVVAPIFTGTDNCEGAFTPVVTTDGATNIGCLYSQTWTANYTDACGNAATPVSITYTWTVDTEAPVLTTTAVSGDLGCNPTVVAPIFTGSDNCEGTITPEVTTDGVTNTGCLYSQTWTATYTDACGNAATPVSITYTWTVDTEVPVINTLAVSGDLGCNPTVVAPIFTGSDNCEGAITPLVSTDGATNNGCLYSQTWTATYTDACGNEATPVSITYTWTEDTEAPVLSTTSVSGDLGCNPTVIAPIFTGTDNCEGTITPLVSTDGATNNGCLYSQTWTATYTDACDNAAIPVSITYTWTEDTEVPVINTLAVSGDLGCNPTVVAPVFTGSDNCEGAITPLVSTDGATNIGCLYSQTWTANYTDSCGNAATPVSITYTWTVDTEAPVLSTIAVSGDLGCNPTVVAPVFSGSDNCEGAITPLVTTDGATNNGCLYSQTWTANYTDSCGNAATPVSITYTWTEDLEAPVLSTTAVSGDLGCNPTVVAPVFTGSDNCEGVITPVVTTDGATNNGCLYSQTWTATYTDACGNAATPVSITYTWTVDTEAPVLTTTAVSGDLGCNPTVVAPIFTGSDNCEGAITPVVSTDGATNNGCLYSQTWTSTYTDACDNAATPVSITYTWTVDTEAPVLTTTAVSGDLGCNPTVVAPIFTGTDNCEGAITPVVSTDGATNNGCLYSQTWTATYTDACGNAATPVSITYTWTVDTEAPVLTTTAVSGDLGCNPTVVAPIFTGTDNCEGAFTPVVTTDGATNIGCLYSQTWTANYTDACGNAATPVSITYTWTVDTEAPVLTTTAVSGDLGCNPTVVAPIFTGSDNCEGTITPEVTTDGVTNTGCLYSQTWTATYTDACGNAATPVSITYTWTVDTEVPVINTLAVSGDLGCNPTVVAPIFTGSDNCEGAITPLVSTDGATNNGCLYSQTWTATYTDACGNEATPVSITYTWTEDTEAPVLSTTSVSGDLGCNPTVIAPIFTGTDNCEGTITPLVSTDGATNNGCLYSQTWTATYTDACDNAAIPVSITYTWTEDTEVPVINTLAVSGDLGCNPTVVAPVFTGSDNCEGAITPLVSTDGATNIGCLYSQTWTANYTDSCGNAATPVSITYTWTVDTEAPVLSTIAVSGDLGCNPTVVAPVFSGSDNCEGAITPLVTTDGATNNGCLYSQTWTANYTDSCGNAATPVSITYTWTEDLEAPVLSTTAVSGDLGCNPTVVAPVFTGSDNCEGVITPVVTTDGATNNGCLYSQTWTATYTDACGNAATPVSITYTWTVDTEAPVLTTTAVSGDLGCNPTVVAPIFTGSDNCEGAITPVVSTDGATNNGCLYSQTWTSTYTDACDNAATPVSITYTWTVDTEAPVLTTTAVSGDLGCNPTVVAPIFTGTDNCEGAITPVVSTDGATNNGCLYSQTWTATYTDACGNAATPVSITYTWTVDTEAPVLTTTAVSGDLGCNPTVVAPIFTGTDNCEGAFTPVVTTDGATNIGCLYSQTWTANYTDACGNAATPVSITYTWTVDTEAPVLTTTAVSGDLGCNPTVVAPIFTGSDNCEGTITPEVTTDGVTNTGCLYSQTWTATYTDACGNAATPVSITYTWTVDTEVPVINTLAVSGDLGCNPTVVAPIFTGSDNCEGAITPLVSTDGATNNGCLYSQTWTATYTDACGNEATPVSITYTWTEDTEAPVLSTTSVSGDLGCNPTVIAPIFTGTDNCEGTITPLVSTDGATNNGCLYSQTWTATYTDACDNAAIPVSITYTWTEDTEVPVINTLAVSGDLGCNPTVVAPVFTGSDNCEGAITPLVSTDGATNNGCLYSQTWTANYTDSCGNAATPVSITYTWTVDTEAPVFLACPVLQIDLGNNPSSLPDSNMAITDAGSVTDNCNLASLNATGSSISGGNIKTQIWTVTATDDCGNTSTCEVSYNWTEFIELNITVFLEGLYVGNGEMRKAQDIDTATYNIIDKFPGDVADQISIQLWRDAGGGNGVLDTTIENIGLSTSGNAIVLVDPVFNDEYYVYVVHRNSITISSATPISFNSNVINYNYSSDSSLVYCENVRNMNGGIYAMYAGDINQDGDIGVMDFVLWDNASRQFFEGYVEEDINGDAEVGASDVIFIDNNSRSFVSICVPFY